ncbi:MAG: autotransporter domain-containing protein [Pseudomonadota bacterium]
MPIFVAPTVLSPTTAYAACTPAVASNSAVIVCEGTTQSAGTNVLGTGAETDVTLTIRSGATILGTGGDLGVELGGDAQITNHGTIQSGARAIDIDGELINLNNHGLIDGLDRAIVVNGNLSNLINHGTIQGSGTDGIAIDTFVAGNITNLVNYGSIVGGDGALFGQNIDNLVNYGSIVGDDEAAVRAADGLSNIINSGTIESDLGGGGLALHEIGAFDTQLTLNAGSILIGRADLGGGTNTLNVGEGLSLNSTFESEGGATFISLGALRGHLAATSPVAGGGTNNDAQAVAVDLSAFAGFDDTLSALTSGIGASIQSRQSTLRSDPTLTFASRFAAAEETSLAAFSDLDLNDTPDLDPNRIWIEGFGAYRQDDGDRIGSDFEHLTGGLVAGVDVPLDSLTSIGVMAGFAASISENEISTQQTDTMSYYACVYASTKAMGLAWDGSLTVGYTDYEQERITANNLVATGLETANADFGGWFINPQVTATRQANNPLAGIGIGLLQGSHALEQSLTLSYAGLFLDSYTETGTTNPLTLDDRSVHVASARAALALPFEASHASGVVTTLRLIGGVEARTQFGDDGVSGTLLGQSVSTTLDDDDATLGAFFGLSGEYQTTTGLTAYADAEALLETDMAYQLSATTGLRVAF